MPRLTLSLPPEDKDAGRDFFGKKLPDPGYINFDDSIDAIDVVQEYKDDNKLVPSFIKQWENAKKFYRVSFKVRLECDEKYYGASELRLTAGVIGVGGTVPPQIDDVGPDSEWVSKGISGEGTIKIETSFLNGLLKLTPLGNVPIPEVSAAFNYKWNPKVAKVITGAAGQGAQWVMRAMDKEYLDGDHQLILLIRAPHDVQHLKLKIYSAWAKYKSKIPPLLHDSFTEPGIVEIPINFQK